MGRRLKDSLTSRYLGAANMLNSKKSRRRIVAYVESYDDVFFWRTVLSRFENDERYFQVMLPVRSEHLNRGKKAVMMSLLRDRVGEAMIACVDADYDYLIQGATSTSREILSNPYIFHTYVYAIENFQCYAPSLHDVCVAVTLNDHDLFDMEDYLRRYSQVIYPLFVWSIWFHRRADYARFTMAEFLSIAELGKFSIVHADELLQRLNRKVTRKVAELQRQNPDARQSWQEVKADLQRLGVTADTTYLYIQGHHLFDKIVSPMLSKVCSQLVSEREGEISRESMHGVQRRNELSCYMNSVEKVTSMLKKNMGYAFSEPFHRIQADIENFLKKFGDRQEEQSPNE